MIKMEKNKARIFCQGEYVWRTPLVFLYGKDLLAKVSQMEGFD